mmetsp:Transcript_9461/g.17070  ORF Transcript_9461/g.17070 Transcript_9461/m.17070 type:complete len:256 (-) Transcript_9461:91-858(-)
MASSTDYENLDELFDAVLGDGAFDFILEKDGGDDGFELDCRHTSSFESSGMDVKIETLGRCDIIREQEEEAGLPVNSVDCQHSRRCKRKCSPSPRPQHNQQVNFDPPVKRFTYSGVSMRSMHSSSDGTSANQQISEESASIHPYSKDQYSEALNNLAESMKRSEMTRCHVMMQRNMLVLQQQRALYLSKERIPNQQTQQKQQVKQRQQQLSSTVLNHPVVTSFFHGSTRTLFADKMGQSSNKIGMYMGQVNQKTF